MKLDQDYWTERYRSGNIPWDLGEVSPPLKHYFDQIEDKNKSILIPGAGNAHEAVYLYHQGFTDITICDLSDIPLEAIRTKYPEAHFKLLQSNFFELSGQYDLIVEQTFFCAIDRTSRESYAIKGIELLKSGGKIIGLLFANEFEKAGPPFGGCVEEYENLFRRYYKNVYIEACHNSILPRSGNELFIILQK